MPQRPITDLEGNIIGYAPSYQAPAIQSNEGANTPTIPSLNTATTQDDDVPWNRPQRPNPNGNTPTVTTTDETEGGGTGYWKSGPEVEALQKDLISQGYKLPIYGVDAKYGKETDAAFKQRQKDLEYWGDAYMVDPENLEYHAESGTWRPPDGFESDARGSTEIYNRETNTWEDEFYAYDNEGNAVTKEEFDKLYPDEDPEKKIEDPNANANMTTEEKKKWYQKLGVNSNDILNVIEGLTIMKAHRNAMNENKKIGELKVDSKTARPQTYNPELVDLSEAKKNAKELATAAVQKNIQEGKSTAETRALLTAGTDAQEKIAKTESEQQKEQSNIAKKMNMDERRAVEQFNITNDRRDQIENNDTMASMYKNSIALHQNMRDAILTKIKDYKLLASAEKQMKVIGDAISGKSGLAERKYNDYIDEMVGYGVLTADKGATMKSDYAAMQSNQMQLVESKPGEGAPENEKKDSWWQRRKKRREAERQAENDALYLDDQGNPIMAD